MTAIHSQDRSAESSLLDAFGVAALRVDRSGTIVFLNQAAEREVGGPGGVSVGEPLSGCLLDAGLSDPLDAVSAQVLGGQLWRGRFDLCRADGSVQPAEVTCAPVWQERAVSGFVCVIDEFAAQRDTDADDRRLGDRLTRLARVTSELVTADTVDAVTKIVVTHAADAVGATMATLTLREGDDHLRLVGMRGGQARDEEKWSSFPLSTPTPSSDAVRTGRPVILTGAAAIAERYPDLTGMLPGERSFVCLPLLAGSRRSIGAVGLWFPDRRALGPAELEFVDILADTCAQALERISAQEVAARQTAKLVFLGDVSNELASSLDYGITLASVARLAVPTFADWCAIDTVQDSRLHRVAVQHVDPAKVQLAQDLAERYAPDPNASSGAWHVMRTGRSELIAEITDEMLVAGAKDDEHLRIARDLHLRSALTVPLVARGRVLGVITWVFAESERHYTTEDLALAEELAKRAAIAIDNAELHSETLAVAEQLQRAVLPLTMPALPGWDLASLYNPAGRTEVGGDFYDAIPLGDGRLLMFVGDVMGRGVAAAASMAQMRAAVRAFAAIDPTPATVMARLDQMFVQFPSDQLVTLVYMLADAIQDELVICNAGHPPPVILRADLTVDELPWAEGCPLGVVPQKRREVTVAFGSGDTLLAFTDGLIERREEDIDSGQQRVVEALPGLFAPDLDDALAEVVARLTDPSRDDDVAALAARRTPRQTPPHRSRALPSPSR